MRAALRALGSLACRILASPDKNTGKHSRALYSGGNTYNETPLVHNAQRSAGWSGAYAAETYPAYSSRQVRSRRRTLLLLRQKITPALNSGKAAGTGGSGRLPATKPSWKR